MSLDPNQPTDQVVSSEWPSWIRAMAVAINAVTAGAGFTVTNLVVDGGATSLTIGHELSAVGHEVIFASCLTGATLATILGGTDGQIKTFIYEDSAVDMLDGVKSDGKFYLNEAVALVTFLPELDDVLCLVNVGGDGALAYGYWKELYRSISLK